MITTEVVLYQIKADQVAYYSAISNIADKFLETRSGFINRTVRQDHKDETLFLDIVEWETLEDALSASEALQNEPTLMPFLGALEKVIHFNHLHSFN